MEQEVSEPDQFWNGKFILPREKAKSDRVLVFPFPLPNRTY